MSRKTTINLVLLAAVLFTYVWFFERGKEAAARKQALLFESFRPDLVKSIEVSRTNATTRLPFLITLERHGEEWAFSNPAYPAQPTGIENLLRTIAQLPRRAHINASELMAGDLKAFGLNPPSAAIVITSPTNRVRLEIGSRTPIADQVYVQVVGSPGIYLTDSSLLQHLPETETQWRDPRLINFSGLVFDRIHLRAGARITEVERDRTNLLWKISKPITARADSNSVAQLLRDLHDARVASFVKDTPVSDLERFGLQPPEAEVFLALDTNELASVEFGNSPTNDPAHFYARLSQRTNIVLVDKDFVERMRIPYKALQDTRLISIPASVDRIEVQANSTNFSVLRQPNGLWRFAEPENGWADRSLVTDLILNINSLRILDFAKEVPSESDLTRSGLLPPKRQYSFYLSQTNAAGLPTNVLAGQVEFGTDVLEKIYVRRKDEVPVYFTSFPDVHGLPSNAWELRERSIWNFSSTNVLSIRLVKAGETNLLSRTAAGQWSADPIKNAALEEVIFRLGQLRAQAWVAHGTQRAAAFGFVPPAETLLVELRSGEKTQTLTLHVGIRGRNTIYCMSTLEADGVPTIFQIPEKVYLDLRNEAF